jgi:transposase
MRDAGTSIRDIAKVVKKSPMTIQRLLKAVRVLTKAA